MSAHVLIAEDDPSLATVLTHALRRKGYTPLHTADGSELMRWVMQEKGDALITDVLMPYAGEDASSFDWLPRIREMRPTLPIIVVSAQRNLMTAVKAKELGAYDYLPKPFDLDALLDALEKALAEQKESLVLPFDKQALAEPLVGSSPAMQRVYKALAQMVGVELSVLITGESGTGKELVARAIHSLGARAKRPFIAINMAAIPKELVESELFGHEKGAFTGATARKAGKFELADGGTLFLDEIGDMPPDAQGKLLRVLQEGEFISVGGARPRRTDVRIIAATHRDLAARVQEGSFREDLYYRLNVLPLSMPSLRDRKEDIPLLTESFLRKAAEKGLPEKRISPEAMELLAVHEWPGNVRELENAVYRLCTLAPGQVIDAEVISLALSPQSAGGMQKTAMKSLEQMVEEHLRAYFSAHEGALPPDGLHERILPLVERPLIRQALLATEGNCLRAAKLLGINRNTLRTRMRALGISADAK